MEEGEGYRVNSEGYIDISKAIKKGVKVRRVEGGKG